MSDKAKEAPQLLEEDDEFEEFPAEGEAAAAQTATDDDNNDIRCFRSSSVCVCVCVCVSE